MPREKNWWKHAKIYELYVDAFAGNFAALTARLEYFTQLGINCLHILPHFPSPMVDDGYDIVDYRSVRADLGTFDDCMQFIKEAHGRGIKVIIDFALNHTSDQHPWFLEAKSSRDNPKRDFYLWSTDQTKFAGATNAFPDIKAQNWIFNPDTDDLYFATFYPQQPDLNWDNPQVFEEMLSNMEFWAGHGVDGFRLDAACYLLKREGTSSKGLPETHQLIKRIRARLEAKHPNVVLLAEAAQDIESSKEYFGAGDECHMVYNFPLMQQMWLAIQSGVREPLDAMTLFSFDIPDNCQWAVFLRNHDETEFNILSPDERHKLINFLDPGHKYLFNKGEATSVRIADAFNGDRKGIADALGLLYSGPGAPVMYYGDEIGMHNLPVEESIIDSRRYVRGTFDWLSADAQSKDPDSLLNQVAKIIRTARK
jgi:maltose alpha-D-glucosyltransferase / alpha-amylase